MAANAPSARLRMRHPVGGPRGGGLYVSELQRGRLLDAAFALVAEQGYGGMTVRKVSERAGVSSKTFYDLFSDREDCFLAAFDQAVEECAAVAGPAYEGEGEWVARVRAALGALLYFLDREPELCRLVFIEALGAGPRVLERRARVLEEVASVIDRGRAGVKGAGELPPLMAEGIVSATFGVIHARLLQQPPEQLSALQNALMATIILPYRGRKAAARELKRPPSKAGPRLRPADKSRFSGPAGRTSGSRAGSRQSSGSCVGPGRTSGSRAGSGRTSGSCADFRLTVRTQAVLAALAGLGGRASGPSNREVSELVGVSDQGQISRLMARLQEQGLAENTGARGQGAPKAWRLTPQGEEVVHANPPLHHGHPNRLGVKR